MADSFSSKPWGQFSEGDYEDAGDYCDASLINENTGSRESWTKDKCHLPVREPHHGPVNRNGVHAAAVRIGATKASPAAKKSAAAKLRSLYSRMGEKPPPSIAN